MSPIASVTSNADLDRVALEQDRRHLFTLFADLHAQSNKEWLVRHFLGAGEASAFYGKPGDGKSVLAQDMALHIAAGWPWHGRPVRRGAVVYVALERRKLVERRAIAFRVKHGVTDLPFAIVGGVHDFRDPRTADHIVGLCRQVEDATTEPVVLIEIDTISRALAGGDENSPKDMGAIVNATGRMNAGTGAAVLWVHHMPIDGERMRGHGALLGALDTTVHVEKSGTVRTATVVKSNDSEEGERIAFNLESVVIGTIDGEETTAPVVVPQTGEIARALRLPRKLSDRHKLALSALGEAVLQSGQPAPTNYELPAGIRLVTLEGWREELFKRGVIESDDANPRATFKRIKEKLAVSSLIGMREQHVWPA